MKAFRHGAVHGRSAPIPSYQNILIAPIDPTYIPWSIRTYPELSKYTNRTYIRCIGADANRYGWIRIVTSCE